MLAILALGLSVGACKKKVSSADYGLKLDETLRMVISTEPPTLDWSKSSDTSSSFVIDNLMEGLVSYDFSTKEVGIKPALAKSWTSSNKSKNWEFILRDDIVWTDGIPLTPQHVIDGWERLLNPKTASVYAYFLFGVKNAEKYNNGTIKDFSQVGVKLDGHKLSVELNEPANFPYLLTHHSNFPVRNDLILKHGDRWTEAENIVTLGAYKLKVWEHDRALVFERNDAYFGEKPKTKNVVAYVIEEQGTAINLFKGGQVDALKDLPSALLGVLKRMKEYQNGAALISYYYGFNTKKPPMDNVWLRRAIVAAVDRKQITDMLDGGQTPMSGWIPQGMFGHKPDAGIQFDLTKAEEYYKKAGYSKENPAPRIVLAFNTLEDHKRIAENIQAQLKKNLNLTVEINNEEWKVYLGTLQSNPPHIYRMGWVADYPDAYNFFDLMTSTSDNNHTGWEDPSYDLLLRRSAEAESLDEKEKFYSEAEHKLLYEAAAAFPIYSGVNKHLVSTRIKNFPENAMSRYILNEVEIVKK